MMSNTQHKLDKSRPPRVQITYDVETGGAETAKELPLVIGVLGEYSSTDIPPGERKFINVDKDNFNDVMASMHPGAEFLIDSIIPGTEGKMQVSLTFSHMDDFTPDNVIQKIPSLKKLAELRANLSELKNKTASNEKLKLKIQQLIEDNNKLSDVENRKAYE